VDPKIIQAMVVQMKMNEIAAMRRITAKSSLALRRAG
jgi:hypothetical protein